MLTEESAKNVTHFFIKLNVNKNVYNLRAISSNICVYNIRLQAILK